MIEIIAQFFKMGLTAFGGPAAHIAIMQDELVEKKRWLSHKQFSELLGLTNLIPGPNSTEMAMLCGYARGGFWGFIVAGISFIFPAFILTVLAAIVYIKYRDISWVPPLVQGMKPAVIIVILIAVWKLGKKSLTGHMHYSLFLLTLLANYFFISEIMAIFICATAYMLWKYYDRNNFVANVILFIPFKSISFSIGSGSIFWVFAKIGFVLFGSGYVLVAYLDAFLVQDLGWIDRTILLDSIAIGQFTPGPCSNNCQFPGLLPWRLDGSTCGHNWHIFTFIYIHFDIIPFDRKN